MSSEYDIIFAGGGTAACVTAGRLIASKPSLKILVVESGKHSRDVPSVVQPCRSVDHFAEDSTTLARYTSKPSKFLDGRSVVVPTGHMVGGGSAVNSLVYVRGAQSDYDDWAALGNEGWGFEDLLPLIRKLETYTPIAQRSTHGYEGPIQISPAGLDLGIGTQFLGIARKYDPKRPVVDDNNDFKTADAYAPSYKYIDSATGKRSYAASEYLYPHTDNPNLEILAETKVKRVVIENGRAVGIEYMTGVGSVTIAKAKQLVVVSAGAFGSPGILERSGIGSSSILEKRGIPVVVDLPGVGENYLDHVYSGFVCYAPDGKDTMDDVWTDPEATKGKAFIVPGPMSYAAWLRGTLMALPAYLNEWRDTGRGKIATNGIEALGKIRPRKEELKVLGPEFQPRWESFFENQPDKTAGVIAPVAGLFGPGYKGPWKFIGLAYSIMYAESVGSVHIGDGQDPNAPVDFDSGFLSKPSDLVLLVWFYKKARELVRRLPSYRGEVAMFHPKFPAGSAAAIKERDTPASTDAPDIVYAEGDDEAISQFVRETASTTFHSLGTCAMKSHDQGGVVDAHLNVYGVQGLKVADLSICPTTVGNNTNSTALLIGEKAAVIIAQDLSLSLN